MGEMLRNADLVHCRYVKDGNLKKMNKRAKEKYQLGEQTRLLNLKNGHNTGEFWHEIGKLGIQNERKTGIPMEVKDSNDRVSAHTNDVMDR